MPSSQGEHVGVVAPRVGGRAAGGCARLDQALDGVPAHAALAAVVDLEVAGGLGEAERVVVVVDPVVLEEEVRRGRVQVLGVGRRDGGSLLLLPRVREGVGEAAGGGDRPRRLIHGRKVVGPVRVGVGVVAECRHARPRDAGRVDPPLRGLRVRPEVLLARGAALGGAGVVVVHRALGVVLVLDHGGAVEDVAGGAVEDDLPGLLRALDEVHPVCRHGAGLGAEGDLLRVGRAAEGALGEGRVPGLGAVSLRGVGHPRRQGRRGLEDGTRLTQHPSPREPFAGRRVAGIRQDPAVAGDRHVEAAAPGGGNATRGLHEADGVRAGTGQDVVARQGQRVGLGRRQAERGGVLAHPRAGDVSRRPAPGSGQVAGPAQGPQRAEPLVPGGPGTAAGLGQEGLEAVPGRGRRDHRLRHRAGVQGLGELRHTVQGAQRAGAGRGGGPGRRGGERGAHHRSGEQAHPHRQ